MGYFALLLIGIIIGFYVVGQLKWLRDLHAGAWRRRRDAETTVRSVPASNARTLPKLVRRPPLCLEALGLTSSATSDDIIAAYRQLALDLHPDHGGDPDEFKRLHRNFEQAMAYAEGRAAAKPSKPR